MDYTFLKEKSTEQVKKEIIQVYRESKKLTPEKAVDKIVPIMIVLEDSTPTK